jgi:hypothetical protein
LNTWFWYLFITSLVTYMVCSTYTKFHGLKIPTKDSTKNDILRTKINSQYRIKYRIKNSNNGDHTSQHYSKIHFFIYVLSFIKHPGGKLKSKFKYPSFWWVFLCNWIQRRNFELTIKRIWFKWTNNRNRWKLLFSNIYIYLKKTH